MIPALKIEDLRIIGYNLGKICYLVGGMILLPVVVALLYYEFDTIPYFLTGAAVAFILGSFLSHFLRTKSDMELKHAVTMAAIAWLLAPLLASIPIWLSNATASLLDASFESISGFTGTGLTLALDIDHLPRSINFLRHFLQFTGDGIGIIVVYLSILGRTQISSVLAYKGEAKEVGIRPSIVRTSRVIVGIAITFLIIGTILFAAAGVEEGLDLGTSIYDGLNHAMTGYATGGFSTRSQNLLFYHSSWIEIAAIVTMITGVLNFNLHYVVLGGKKREILKNIEVRLLFLFILVIGLIVSANLLFSNLYLTGESLFRKSIFHVISAQTTTGFQTIPPTHFMFFWPVLSMVLISIAMIIGGSANSTSGGIKILRIGILLKSIVREVRQALLPKSAFVRETFHNIDDTPLTDTVVKGAAVITISYLLLFSIGTLVTVAYGYGMEDSMFETSSALGNVGLSSGITSPSMPDLLKVTYMFLMWAGKIEIIAVLVLIGFIILGIRRGFER